MQYPKIEVVTLTLVLSTLAACGDLSDPDKNRHNENQESDAPLSFSYEEAGCPQGRRQFPSYEEYCWFLSRSPQAESCDYSRRVQLFNTHCENKNFKWLRGLECEVKLDKDTESDPFHATHKYCVDDQKPSLKTEPMVLYQDPMGREVKFSIELQMQDPGSSAGWRLEKYNLEFQGPSGYVSTSPASRTRAGPGEAKHAVAMPLEDIQFQMVCRNVARCQ